MKLSTRKLTQKEVTEIISESDAIKSWNNSYIWRTIRKDNRYYSYIVMYRFTDNKWDLRGGIRVPKNWAGKQIAQEFFKFFKA